MNIKKTAFLFSLLFLLLSVLSLHAQVPPLIDFQGKLLDKNNQPINNSSLLMTFSFYSDSGGVNKLWSETKNVSVSNGVFFTYLGSVNSIPAAIFLNPAVYLGETISPDVTDALPRERFLATAYSFVASQLISTGSIAISPGGGGVNVSTLSADGNLILAYGIRATTGTFAGNVGIGTTNPATKLHVPGGDVQVGDATASTISASGYLTMANLGSAPGTAVPGRVYYDSSINTLRFSTASNANAWVSISTMTGEAPLGMVAFFNLTSCPNGWSELSAAEGNYLVGLHIASPTALGTTVGTALVDQENRPTGQHTHAITDPGHSHGGFAECDTGSSNYGVTAAGGAWQNCPVGTGGSVYINVGTVGAYTGIGIQNSGSVAGTNAPYLELLACQCVTPGYCQPASSGGAASATVNIAGGSANQIPYQTGSSATTFTGTPGANVVLSANSGAPTWTNTPTLTGTNFSGTASGLTVGYVTTNANLTGPITSLGNATSIASQTGTGSTFVMSAAPTITGSLTLSGGIGPISGAPSGSQGAYMAWNALTGGTGESDFINNEGGGSGGFAFINANSSGVQLSTPMFIEGGGSVGISTNSPSHALDIQGGDGYLNAKTRLCIAGSCITTFGSPTNYWTLSGSYLYNNSGTDIGIGTTSPGANLDVNGNAQFGSGVTKSTFTTTGALNLATPLAIASGGTGLTASGTAGYYLRSNGSAFVATAPQTAMYIQSAAGCGASGVLTLASTCSPGSCSCGSGCTTYITCANVCGGSGTPVTCSNTFVGYLRP